MRQETQLIQEQIAKLNLLETHSKEIMRHETETTKELNRFQNDVHTMRQMSGNYASINKVLTEASRLPLAERDAAFVDWCISHAGSVGPFAPELSQLRQRIEESLHRLEAEARVPCDGGQATFVACQRTVL